MAKSTAEKASVSAHMKKYWAAVDKKASELGVSPREAQRIMKDEKRAQKGESSERRNGAAIPAAIARRMGRRPRKQKVQPQTTRVSYGAPNVDDLAAASQLAQSLGGIDEAISALESLRELQVTTP